MFEPSLFTEALAATAAPQEAQPLIDQQTMLAVIGAIVTGIVTGVGALLYRKSPNGAAASGQASSTAAVSPPGGASDGVHLYFDGIVAPLKAITEGQAKISEGHEKISEALEKVSTAVNAQTATEANLVVAVNSLRELIMQEAKDTRHTLAGQLLRVGQSCESESDEIKNAVRRVGEAMTDMSENVVRIEERTRHKN
jgi:hypothetical protein